MILKLTYGDVEIELILIRLLNLKRFKELANSEKYDGVVFHRVIDGLWLKLVMSNLEIRQCKF